MPRFAARARGGAAYQLAGVVRSGRLVFALALARDQIPVKQKACNGPGLYFRGTDGRL
jgi:hypothetical protein